MKMMFRRVVGAALMLGLASVASGAEARGFGGGRVFVPHAGGFHGGFARPGFGGGFRGYRGGYGFRRFGVAPLVGAGVLGLGALGAYEYYNRPAYAYPYDDACTLATQNPYRCDNGYGY